MNQEPAWYSYSLAHGGEIIYPLNPAKTEIRLTSIAHALATLNRYTGHAAYPYSVAEHSVHVSYLVERAHGRELARAGLMHDAHEAYLGDCSSAVKRAMRAITHGESPFDVLEDQWSARIRAAFDVSWDEHTAEVVKHADTIALMTERHALMPESVAWPDAPEDERDDDWFTDRARRVRGVPPWMYARALFLARAAELGVRP